MLAAACDVGSCDKRERSGAPPCLSPPPLPPPSPVRSVPEAAEVSQACARGLRRLRLTDEHASPSTESMGDTPSEEIRTLSTRRGVVSPPSPTLTEPEGLLLPSEFALPGSAMARMLAAARLDHRPAAKERATVDISSGVPHTPEEVAASSADSFQQFGSCKTDVIPSPRRSSQRGAKASGAASSLLSSRCPTSFVQREEPRAMPPWRNGAYVAIHPLRNEPASSGPSAPCIPNPAPLSLSVRRAVGACVVGPPGLRPPPNTEALPSGFHSRASLVRARKLEEEGTSTFRPPDRPTISSAAKQKEARSPPPPPLRSRSFRKEPRAVSHEVAERGPSLFPVWSPVEMFDGFGGRFGGGGWRQAEYDSAAREMSRRQGSHGSGSSPRLTAEPPLAQPEIGSGGLPMAVPLIGRSSVPSRSSGFAERHALQAAHFDDYYPP